MPPFSLAMANTFSPAEELEAYGYGGCPPRASEQDENSNE
jgi:hypothetical protein